MDSHRISDVNQMESKRCGIRQNKIMSAFSSVSVWMAEYAMKIIV